MSSTPSSGPGNEVESQDAARGTASARRVFFDVPYLYYLTQFTPVYQVLREKGVGCHFVLYQRSKQPTELVRRVVERLALPASIVASSEEAARIYAREAPDWVLFGHNFDHLGELPGPTRSAQIHHGIGMTGSIYEERLDDMDVRFLEGPDHVARIRATNPRAELVEAGYVKVDPVFWSPERRPSFDLASVGLDPARPTVMYAPTNFPSSLGAMPDAWPEHFSAFNLIVKPHQFSILNPRYKLHQRKMAGWSRYPNVFVAPPEIHDPLPLMLVSALLISDWSSVLFEFAAVDRPIVWCDFHHVPWAYRGPFRYRLERRINREMAQYAGIAVHARTYRELLPLVQSELAAPDRLKAERAACTEKLFGRTDGHAADRIVERLLRPPEPGEAAPPV